MDKVIYILNEILKSLCIEYKNKVLLTPSWKLESTLPSVLKGQSLNKQIDFLVERYKMNNPIYLSFEKDLNTLKQKKGDTISKDDLKSLDLDPRYLESFGFNEKQITEYYENISKIKALLH